MCLNGLPPFGISRVPWTLDHFVGIAIGLLGLIHRLLHQFHCRGGFLDVRGDLGDADADGEGEGGVIPGDGIVGVG